MNSPVSKFSRTAPSDRFYFGATAILILGIVLRQWSLGDAPFHPDETIHTFFSGGFATYKYDPVYHGPLLYHLVASVFGLFGQHDYTARLVPSLLGIVLLGMVLGPMRQYLGSRGALAATALLAVSPSVVSYSRRLLHDSLALVLTLGAVWCFLLALEHAANTEKGRNARIGVSAFLTLFLATKANCFFIAAMLGTFYVAWLLSGLQESRLNKLTRWVPPLLFVIVCAASVAWPRNNDATDAVKLFEHSLFVRIGVISCVAFALWIMTGSRPKPNQDEVSEAKAKELTNESLMTYILALATVLWLYWFLFGNGAQILIQWAQTRHFPTDTFVEGNISARTAIKRMLDYWGGQQKTPRLPGRHDYYLVLALLYEIPVLAVAMGGIWHAIKHRSTFTDLLLWWSFSSWTVYAIANEKVPWLLVHSVLPLTLLGGYWLGQVRWNSWKRPTLYGAAALGLFISMRGVIGTNFERGGDNVEPMFYAQTPEAFRDALHEALVQTAGDDRVVWMANERQWPSLWYLRTNAPDMGKSKSSIEGTGRPQPGDLRAAVTDEKTWPYFEKAGWSGKTVDFLIWPRASWAAIVPSRYFHWFLTREAVPADERPFAQTEWKKSILSGKGEWSHATAIIGVPGIK